MAVKYGDNLFCRLRTARNQSLLLGKLLDSSIEYLLQFIVQDQFCRALTCVTNLLFKPALPMPLFAQKIARCIYCDCIKPGVERGTFSEAAHVFIGLDKGLLQDIFSIFDIAHHAKAQAKGLAPVKGYQFAKNLLVAGFNFIDNLLFLSRHIYLLPRPPPPPEPPYPIGPRCCLCCSFLFSMCFFTRSYFCASSFFSFSKRCWECAFLFSIISLNF